MTTNKKIQQLIERVVDNEGTQQDVYELLNIFNEEFKHYEYFVLYSLMRKLYPKDGNQILPLN